MTPWEVDVHRAASRRQEWIGRLAELAGRYAGSLMRTIPGSGGALLLALGLGMMYRPLFFVAGGVLLLVVDRRVQ